MYRKHVCVAALCLAMAMVGSAGAQTILFEFWDNIGGGTAVSDLTSNALYPDNPTSSAFLEVFQSPSGRADNYGVRARAYLTPPETGDYTFWVAGDDNCQLWLSTDDTAANATMIAQVASWTGVAEWGKEAGQQSAPQSLVAGQAYYIEGLMKEGGGGDSLDVGWAGPGIGDATTVIAGQYCTPFVRLQARSPEPADGAVDVTSPMFKWVPGDTAAMHDVYVGTTPELTADNLQMGTWPNMFYYLGTLEPGVTYYWRADGIAADGSRITGKVWSFTVQPMTASRPNPEDGAVDIAVLPTLSWAVGQTAVSHMVYLSADEALVTAGDASVLVASQAETSFTVTADLAAFSKYFWRVDEVDAEGAVIAGPVWSFSTVVYTPILDGQTALLYGNRLAPYITSVDVATPLDLTAEGKLSDLAIRFQGRAARTDGTGELSYDEATGSYSLTGTGADIWNNADEFRYAYKALNGDGTMVARVTSVGTGTSEWSKGGVMIRQSLAAGSTHAFMPITGASATAAAGGNGASFQRRLETNGASSNFDSTTVVTAPYWVKIERVGSSFTGSVSADGVAWTQMGDPVTIAMADPVLIGLAVTSHTSGELRTFTFDNVATTGNVTPEGAFEACDYIPITGNDPAPISVSLTDGNGNVATVAYDDPAATQITESTMWKIPLFRFAGVDPTNVVSMQLAVGDGLPDGTGIVTFGPVRTVLPEVADVTAPGDEVIGVPNDGDWPGAEYPALAIDDNVSTKFLHFKGETEASGIIVTPSMGYTLVTGLTFTTANDAAERDPAAYELYGSQTGADDSWELIASGAIVDFTQTAAWPRFTKNTTPIEFPNTVAYAQYKVMVTAVRAASSANSMQVAEIELLGLAAPEPEKPVVLWVSFHGADDAPSANAAGAGFTEAVDKPYTDLLKANGYNTVRYIQTGTPDLSIVNAAGLVIVSRSVGSGSFQNDAASIWNAQVTAPMILTNGYLLRSSRLGFTAGTSMPDITGDITLTVNDAAHPIFAGIALTDGTMNNPYTGVVVYPTDGTSVARGTSINSDAPNAEGAILAVVSQASAATGPAGAMVIGEWQVGASITHSGGAGTDVLGGHRLVFLTGAREKDGIHSETAGLYDLYDDGTQMFLNAVEYMLQ
ncbi:MAG: PA14 domain-containing protein [Phycisphaerales bacterium]